MRSVLKRIVNNLLTFTPIVEFSLSRNEDDTQTQEPTGNKRMRRARRESDSGSDSGGGGGSGGGMPELSQAMPILSVGEPPFPVGFSKKDVEPPVSRTSSFSSKTTTSTVTTSHHRSSLHVPIPKYRDIPLPSAVLKDKRGKWSRSPGPIQYGGSKHADSNNASPAKLLVASAYDADEQDTQFFRSWKSKHPSHSEWTLDKFERALEFLERECQNAESQTEMDRDDIQLKCRNAATIAKAEYVLSVFGNKQRSSSSNADHASRTRLVQGSELEKEMALVGDQESREMARSLEHTVRRSKRSIEELVPIGRLAKVLPMSEENVGLKAVYQYWRDKRQHEGGPLINVAFLKGQGMDHAFENETPESIATVYSRIRELREDLERVRLIADSARKREKIKKELAKLG